jgi:hypothetical protein
VVRNILLSLVLLISSTLWAEPKPLFHKGSEVFRIVTDKSKTPVFKVFTSNATKQAIAMAVNSAWGLSSPEGSKPAVEVRLEKLTLEPVPKKSNELAIKVQISGRELELEPTVSRANLIAGKPVQIVIPETSQEISVFKMISHGKFTLQYKKSLDLLFINNATVKTAIESPLGDDESETLQFNVQGLRQP